MFGGRTASSLNFDMDTNETWIFDIIKSEWHLIDWKAQKQYPQATSNHFATLDEEAGVMYVAGTLFTRTLSTAPYIWSFDVGAETWRREIAVDYLATRLGARPGAFAVLAGTRKLAFTVQSSAKRFTSYVYDAGM
jgi:hypothetical protein